MILVSWFLWFEEISLRELARICQSVFESEHLYSVMAQTKARVDFQLQVVCLSYKMYTRLKYKFRSWFLFHCFFNFKKSLCGSWLGSASLFSVQTSEKSKLLIKKQSSLLNFWSKHVMFLWAHFISFRYSLQFFYMYDISNFWWLYFMAFIFMHVAFVLSTLACLAKFPISERFLRDFFGEWVSWDFLWSEWVQ